MYCHHHSACRIIGFTKRNPPGVTLVLQDILLDSSGLLQGFGNAICLAGNCCGGMILPFLLSYLYSKYGYSGAHLIIGKGSREKKLFFSGPATKALPAPSPLSLVAIGTFFCGFPYLSGP